MVGHGLRPTRKEEGHNGPEGYGARDGAGQLDRVGRAVGRDGAGAVDAETVAGRERPQAEGESRAVERERECHWVCPVGVGGFIPPAR